MLQCDVVFSRIPIVIAFDSREVGEQSFTHAVNKAFVYSNTYESRGEALACRPHVVQCVEVCTVELLFDKDLSVLDNNDAIDILKCPINNARFQQTKSI